MKIPNIKINNFLDWLKKCEAKAGPIWQHWLVDAFIWIPTAVSLLVFWIFPPAPGMAAIVCAGFVSIIVLRKLTDTHRLTCIFLVIGLAVTEIKSIATAEKASRIQFAEVLNRTTSVLNTLTGGNSYPLIDFLSPLKADGTRYKGLKYYYVKHIVDFPSIEGQQIDIPLVVVNQGSYPLTVLSVEPVLLSPNIGKTVGTFAGPITLAMSQKANTQIKIELNLTVGQTSEWRLRTITPYGVFIETVNFRLGYKGYVIQYNLVEIEAVLNDLNGESRLRTIKNGDGWNILPNFRYDDWLSLH